MAMRTFVAVSMLAGITLVAPASFAKGGGHGGGGHGGGGHSGGHSGGSSYGGSSYGAGHASTGGLGSGGSFGTSHSASFSSHSVTFGTHITRGGNATGHAAGFESNGHASFRDGESSASEPVVHSSPEQTAARTALGYANPYAVGATFTSPRPAVVHTVTTHGFNDGHANVPGAPIAVTGRVRGHNPGYTVRGVAVEGSWTPRYHFRVPAMYHGYFSPYVTYADATYWATDWVITDTLVGEELVTEGPTGSGSPPMDVVVKEELREEIAADLAGPAETEASADDPRIRAAFQSRTHVFLVSKDMVVQDHQGHACPLRAADLVRPVSPASPADRSVNVVVLAAKGGECTPGQQVTLTGADLAEFERALLTRVDHARDAVQEGEAAPAPPPAAAPPTDVLY